MNKRLRYVVAALCLIAPAAVTAQSTVLESLRETVFSRWDFQQKFPVAGKLFSAPTSEPERVALVSQLRVAQPQAIANPANPTFADLWADFAMGLALEKTKVGGGEAEMQATSGMAKGNIAVNFELARILTLAGMYQRAHAFQMEVQRSMLEKGYVRVPELAKLELFRATEAMDKGWFQVARQELEFAGRLDPLSPWIPFQLMNMEFREKSPMSWDLGAVWAHFGETVRLLRYYDTQSLLIINLSRCLRTGLGLFGAMALLVLFARYFTRIAHLWAEKLPQQVELRVRYAALALLPLSLAVGGAGYAALALFAAMLLWRHCSQQEKSLLKVTMTGLALIPFFQMWEQSMVRHLDDTLGVNLYHRAYASGFENPLAERLKAYKPGTREDSLFSALANSLACKKQGNYLKAGEQARAAASLERFNPFVLLNNGNLAMVVADYPAAAAAYAEARRAAPDMMETWFNSSQAELYSNNSTQHKKFLDQAAELDAGWVTQFLKDNDENFPEYPPTRKAMDPMLRTGQAWSAAWASLLDLDFLKVRMRIGIYEIPGAWLLLAVFGAGMLLYFRFRQFSQHSHGKDLFECKICGRVVCRICRKGVHCQTCFKTVSGIHENRVKMEMVKRMRTRATLVAVRTGALMNALLPGAGHLYLGRGAGRFAWTLASGVLIGGLWQTNHPIMEYPAFALGPLRWLPWLPLAALYGIFNLTMLRAPVDLGELIPSSAPSEKETVR